MSKLACAKDRHDDCTLQCEAEVEVDLNARPKAFCRQGPASKESFEVALAIKPAPRCEIKHLGERQSSCDPCKTVCLFQVDVDFDCSIESVCTPCKKPKSTVLLDVEIPVKPECHVKNVCRKPKRHDDHQHKKHEQKKGTPKLAQKEVPAKSASKKYFEALSKDRNSLH